MGLSCYRDGVPMCDLSRPRLTGLAGTLALGLWLTPGCDAQRAPAPAASASAPAPPRPTPSVHPNLAKRRRVLVRSGPPLAIQAGKGVGPIRIGATVATIERLMDLKCETLTDQVCRYATRAVEFELDKGVAKSIRVHRPYRPAGGKNPDGQPRIYGIFNGLIPPDVEFGMTVPGAQMTLGKPQRVEKVNDARFGTRELHYYDGLVLEYDQIGDAPLVLGGVRVVPKAG